MSVLLCCVFPCQARIHPEVHPEVPRGEKENAARKENAVRKRKYRNHPSGCLLPSMYRVKRKSSNSTRKNFEASNEPAVCIEYVGTVPSRTFIRSQLPERPRTIIGCLSRAFSKGITERGGGKRFHASVTSFDLTTGIVRGHRLLFPLPLNDLHWCRASCLQRVWRMYV